MKKKGGNPSTVRFTAEDKKILNGLQKRLGIGRSAVLKLAIRKLAES